MCQEINQIEFKLKYVDINSSFIIDGIIFNDIYYIDIFIDNKNIRDFNEDFYDVMIFFSELKKSIYKAGKYLIFTCASGIADDGGWEGVNVINKKETIEWSFYHGERTYLYKFSKRDILMKIDNLKIIINEQIYEKLEPKNVDFPEEW